MDNSPPPPVESPPVSGLSDRCEADLSALASYGNITAVYALLAAVLGFLLVVNVGVTVILLGATLTAAWSEPEAPRGTLKSN
jgi:hypothetical protein